jgi:hypothetical protein
MEVCSLHAQLTGYTYPARAGTSCSVIDMVRGVGVDRLRAHQIVRTPKTSGQCTVTRQKMEGTHMSTFTHVQWPQWHGDQRDSRLMHNRRVSNGDGRGPA